MAAAVATPVGVSPPPPLRSSSRGPPLLLQALQLTRGWGGAARPLFCFLVFSGITPKKTAYVFPNISIKE